MPHPPFLTLFHSINHYSSFDYVPDIIQLKSLKKVGADLKKELDRGVESASKELNKAVHGKEYIVSSIWLACTEKEQNWFYEC